MKQPIKTILFLLISSLTFLNSNSFAQVELSYFSASVNLNNVTLQWGTVLEINNSHFDIEIKKTDSLNWVVKGTVTGNGTTNMPHNYEFIDSGLSIGSYNYRLKQVDFNGSFAYHELNGVVIISPVSISINNNSVPDNFMISQNYPNPFNPKTVINYTIPSNVKLQTSDVKLNIYNLLGEEIETLVNEKQNAGSYKVIFDGSNLPSGIYFYKLTAGNFSGVKKMTLLK